MTTDLDVSECVVCGSQLIVPVVLNGVSIRRLCTMHARESLEEYAMLQAKFQLLLDSGMDREEANNIMCDIVSKLP